MRKSEKIELDDQFLKVLDQEPQASGSLDPEKEQLVLAWQEDPSMTPPKMLLNLKEIYGDSRVKA